MQVKIWFINVDLLDWCEDCADSWRGGWSDFMKLVTSILSDSDAMMIEIVGEQRLISCLLGWSKFLRCDLAFWGSRTRIRINLAPPPCINRQNLLCRSNLCHLLCKVLFFWIPYLLSLLSRHGFFPPLHQMEKQRWRGWWPSSHCLGVCLAWYISHHDDPVMINQPSR